MARAVPLTKGLNAIVDNEDYPRISEFTWCATSNYSGQWYAVTHAHIPGERTIVKMHHLLHGCPLKGFTLDHINRNGCDNRKENVRFCSKSDDNANRRVWAVSGYKGVYVNGKGWQARMKDNGVDYYLGTYDTKLEAAHAYDNGCRALGRAECGLNFPRKKP